MSGRRSRRTRLQPAELAPRADMGIGMGGGAMGWSGWQGANWSPDQGYVYWPTIDPKLEVDQWSRLEIARKVHFLKGNVGLASRITRGLTNLIVGTGLTPQAMTSDADWNHLAEKAYKNRARSALAYSITGQFTAVQAQRLMVETELTDGDAAVVFSKSEGSGALRGFYSGISINNHRNPKLDQSQWVDGIRYDSLERAIAYRFPNEPDGMQFTDVPAENVRYLARLETPGQRRSMSILKAAAKKMIDITELNRFVMNGIKQSAQIGYYLGSNSDEKRIGMGAAFQGEPTQQIQVPVGNGTQTQTVTLKQVFGQGGMVPSLPKGIDIKQLLDARPHQNSRDFVDDFIRDICAGCSSVSSDLLWNIYKLGGANVRYVLADAQTFISAEQQNLVDTWLSQDWIYTIACEMKAGRLRQCKDPEWYTHGWVPPARVTVDFGRDGRILLDFHKYGLITTNRMYKLNGQIAREEITDELEIISWRKKEMQRLQLTPIDLQLYNPMIARMTPAQPGQEDYAQDVPKDTAPDDNDPMEDPGSEEARHHDFQMRFAREMEALSR